MESILKKFVENKITYDEAIEQVKESDFQKMFMESDFLPPRMFKHKIMHILDCEVNVKPIKTSYKKENRLINSLQKISDRVFYHPISSYIHYHEGNCIASDNSILVVAKNTDDKDYINNKYNISLSNLNNVSIHYLNGKVLSGDYLPYKTVIPCHTDFILSQINLKEMTGKVNAVFNLLKKYFSNPVYCTIKINSINWYLHPKSLNNAFQFFLEQGIDTVDIKLCEDVTKPIIIQTNDIKMVIATCLCDNPAYCTIFEQ
jgi:hypothetical protein